MTTPSLEALQAYRLGSQAPILKNDDAAAIPFYQRAISLDPNYAMAYAALGRSYGNHFPFTHAYLYLVDFLQHDATAMQREAASLMENPDGKI